MKFRHICKECKQPFDIESGNKKRIGEYNYYCPFCNTPVRADEFEKLFDDNKVYGNYR